ncbi:MAG: DUF5801 repeats-in-toxin domain-containing protein [Allorhizobium sp.]
MSIEDPRLSSIDNTSAADDFDSAVEQHLGYASETVGEIEVAQAETPDATRTDRLPAQTPPVEVAAATIPTEVKPNEQNVVTLPAGIELDNLEFEVDGENLVLVLADGTEIVVLGGAANIPTFVIGDVELPQVALFAALEGSNINVAAGPDGTFSAQGTPSASRNFNDDPIDAGPEDLPLADLLGDTSFGDELRTGVVFGGDGRPSIPNPLTASFIYDEAVIAGGEGQKVITGRLPFNPGPDSGAISAIGFVGASDVNEGDGLKVLTGFTSGGLPISVTGVSAALTGPDFVALEGRDSEGGLVFTISVNRATGDFTFELVGKLEHPDAGQNGSQDDLDDLLRLGFTYTVTDLDGDFVTGSFNIDVQDDAPTILEIVEGEEGTGGEETGPIETLVKLSDANTVSEDDLDTNEYEFTSGNLGIRWGADDDLKSETLDEKGEATGDDPVGRTLGFTGLNTESTSEEIQAAIPDLANLSSDGFRLSYRIEYTRDEGGNWNGGYRLVAYKDNGDYGDGPYKVAALATAGDELIGEPVYPISKEYGETVFVITLDPTTTNGTYTFELIGNLDHYTVRETDGGSNNDARLVDVEADLIKDGDSDLIEVDELDLEIPFTATDSDGDSVDGQFTVRVEDDEPVVIGEAISHTVDEDDISTIGRFIPGESLGTSPNDGNADGSFTGNSSSNWPGPATVSGSFAGMVDFGADDRITTYSIIDEEEARATLTALGLTSKGGELSFDVIDGTLYAFVNAGAPGVEYNAGQDRLVFSLEVQANGGYAFKLFDQLDHDKPLFGSNENTDLQDDLDDEDVNAIDFGSVIQATDFDGDSVLLTNSFSVTIRDDVPELVRGASEDRTVDEDDISTIGNVIPGESLGTSPNDGAADGSVTGSAGNNQPGPAFISGSLAGLVKSGADEALTFSFINGNVARGMLESLGLSSKGAELSYEIRDGVLYAFDNAGNEQGQSYDANFGDRLVFSLTLNQNGSYEFRLYDQLDHDAPGDDFRERPTNSDENFDLQDGLGFRDVTSINFGALIKATDYDGDSVSLNDAFSIKIRDDVPELSGKEENRLVDEDDIKNGQSTGNFPNDGNGDGSFTGSSNSNGNGPANISGSLANLIKGGADDTVKFSFINENTARATLDRLGLKSEGAELSYDIRDGVLYAFDNAGSQKGESYDPDNGDRLVFTLTLSENGSYTFELVDQLDHDKPSSGANENTDLQDNVFGDVEAIDFGSIIKATDFDGDSVVLKDAFSITVKDDVPVLSGTKEDRIIDEDDISTLGMSQPGESLGTSPNDGASEDQSYTDSPSNNQPGPAYISGSLANLVRGGADDPITFSFINETAIRNQLSLLGLSSKGSTLSYDLQSNGVLYAFDNKGPSTDENYDKNNDRLVFSLKLNSDGSYEFRLFDQLDHDRPFDDKGDGNGIADENFDLRDGSYSEDVTAINFGKLITATDFDGDTISLDGAFSIKVRDDVPTAVARNTSETLVVDETSGQQNDDVAGSLSVFNGVNPKGTDPNMSAQFAEQANFVAAEINGGADDDVDVDWSLKISGGNGSASGLFTTDGRAIVLFLENGLIVGRYDSPTDGNTSVNSSDPAAFALHISDNGTLSMVQYVSIKHDDPADHDENDDANDNNLSTVVQSLAGKIDAVLTVTDYDGDKAVSEVAVGDRIQFHDDGPSINLIAVGEQNVVLQTQDAETIGFGVTDFASSTARFGGVFSIASSSYGADGAGSVSTSYALSLAKGNGSDSGLNHDGSDIKLFLADGTVYGMTQSGELVFSISVDSNGEVTLKQFREIDHTNSYTSGPYSPDVKTLTDGLVKLTATATIIDGDGDRATDSEVIDLGGNIKFQDDGPRINLIATDEQNVVLQTQDAETIGFGVTDYASSTARFGGVFSIASSSYGADGAGSVSTSYALSLAKGNGSDSGLNHDGSDIKLFLADGTVYGMAQSGELVFSISVDSNGEVTLKQFREIDHFNSYTSGPYSPDVKTLTDGLVKLTATATIIDDEGDKASDSETIDLGGNIKFQDDGPSVNVSASGEELVILQTQDGDTKGTDTDYSETSARFGGVFSIASQSYGADGAGTAATLKFALGLYVNAGTDSGLDSDGVDIRLFMVDGVVYGSTISGANPTETSIMDTAVFKIAVDNDGDVKLTQFKEIDHSTSDTVGPYTSDVKTLANGLVKLTASATVIDDEGDKATDSETIDLGGNIKFQDAGPSVKSDTITVSVDEDGLQTAAPDSGKTTEINGGGLVMVPGAVGALTALFDFGADGAHATQAISLKPTTSPVDSGYNSKGSDIFIKVVDGTLTGFVAGTPERVVFELKVNANGSYTFELKDQIDHLTLDGVAPAPNGQFDDAENLLSSIDLSSYIIGKDGDGDTVALTAGKFVVDVRDDIPTVTSSVVEVKIDTPQIVAPVEAKVANFVLVLDTSGSVNVEQFQIQVKNFLENLAATGAKDVRVHIVEFSGDADAVGTYDLIRNGVKDQSALDDALSDIAGLSSGGSTNYEAGMREALDWIEGIPARVLEVDDRTDDFDSSVGGSNDEAYILFNGSTQVAMVSGWTSSTELGDAEGSLTFGWGVDGENLSGNERLRFDFGAFNNYDGPGEYANLGNFNGVPVTSAQFKLDDKVSNGSTTFSYTVHFTDGTSPANGSQTVNGNGTLTITAPAGKQIAYIEFAATSGFGDVDLEKVTTAPDGPLANAHVNELIFLSDGEPNENESNYSSSASEALEQIKNEIAKIESGANAPGDQAFTIQAYGIKPTGNNLTNLGKVEGDGGVAENLTPGNTLSGEYASTFAGLAGTPGSAAPTSANFNLSPLVNVGADEGLTFSMKSGTSGLPVLQSGGVTLVYTVANNILTATAGQSGPTVFTLSLAANGSGTFTLNKPIDGQGDRDVDFSSLIQAQDFDGDAVSLAAGKFVVTVDGVPSGAPQAFETKEDESVSGTIAAIIGDDGVGQNGFSISSGPANGSLLLNTKTGEFTYNPNKNWYGTETFSVTVTDDDGDASAPIVVTVNVTPVNDAPTDIALSAATVAENALGAVIGSLTTSDVDAGDMHSYTVSDSRFEVVGNQLKLKSTESLNFETTPSVNVTVTTKDGGNLSYSETFAITVTNVNETPTDITLTSSTVAENAAGATIGTLVTVDPDVGNTHSYTVSDSRFEVVGNQLKLKDGVSLDHEAAASVDVKVTTTDAGGLSHEKTFAITVTNVNEVVAQDPTGQDKTVNLVEDVTYTFKTADFGFQDADGHTFAGVTVTPPAGSSAGKLMLGNSQISASQFISAEQIAAGMLTWAPADNQIGTNGSTLFTFKVKDSSGAEDPAANEVRLQMSSTNFTDFSETGGFQLGVGVGYANVSLLQTDGGTERITFDNTAAAGDAYSGLNFQRSDNNLEITVTTEGVTRVVTVLNQYAVGNSVWEQVRFDEGVFAGYDFADRTYAISTGLNGGNGNSDDIVAGSAAADLINGGNGRDLLFGNGGNDAINGESGNDLIFGGLGNDTIDGGQDDDVIVGGAGNDVLAGGSGLDRFVWGDEVLSGENADRITDYRAQEDIIDLSRLLPANTSSVNYIKLVRDGNDLLVKVDLDGIGNASAPELAYRLVGGNDLASVVINYGGSNKTFTRPTGGWVAAADPIILDLDKNGFAFSSIDNGVTFDINADGKGDQIAWTSDDGILAYDVDGNGLIDNGSEIFTPDFNGGKFASGVAALASLDSNKDGKIDASDDAFSKLQVWVDADNDGISDEGELSSLSANGVASISLTTDQTGGEEDGQTVFAEGEFTFVDGSTGNFLEVGFDTIFGSENDGLTLHGGMGEVVMTGSAGADTFVFDGTALDELDVADVITDFSTEEGDVLDVTALLDSLLGEQPDATVETHLRATVEGGNTTVSVQAEPGVWKDVVELQNHDTAIKVLFDDKHAVVTPHE